MLRWVARSVLGMVVVAAALLLGGCGSEAYGPKKAPCRYPVEITATVPPIGQETWTVKGCLGASCSWTQLDAKVPGMSTGAMVTILESADGGTWKLVTTLSSTQPMTGQTWSLVVTDSQNNVITQGNGSVHYAQQAGESCPKQHVSIP